MNSPKERPKAAGEEKVHVKKATLVLDKRNFHFGTRDDSAPGILLGFVDGKGAQFSAAEQPDRGTEKDSTGTGENQKKRAQVSNWRTSEFHCFQSSPGLRKGNTNREEE